MARPSMAIEASAEGFRWIPDASGDPVVEAFHAVRRMAYGSTGSRDPRDLVRTGRGACTAKHLLLSQLLSSLGVVSRMRSVPGHFGRGMPEALDMPEELRAMIREGGVPDVHNVVVARLHDNDVVLDATWPDAMIPLGFPVNHDWKGAGDTRLALDGDLAEDDGSDPLAQKVELIAALPQADRQKRLRFLQLLTEYCAKRQD